MAPTVTHSRLVWHSQTLRNGRTPGTIFSFGVGPGLIIPDPEQTAAAVAAVQLCALAQTLRGVWRENTLGRSSDMSSTCSTSKEETRLPKKGAIMFHGKSLEQLRI